MTEPLRSLTEAAGLVRMTAEEKAAIRRTLEAGMVLPSSAGEERSGQAVSGWLSWLRPKMLIGRPALAALLILVLFASGTGVTYAAESALPGDPLYPVKIDVNERARELLAVTPRAKAAWAARRAERRLEEAERLAAAYRLGPAVAEAARQAFRSQVEQARRHLAELEERGDLAGAGTVRSDLEGALRAHKKVMTRLIEKEEGGVERGLDGLAEAADAAARGLAEKEGNAPGSFSSGDAAVIGDRLSAAERKISEVRRFVDRRGWWPPSRAVAEERLTEAVKLIDDGRAALRADDLPKAFALFRAAHESAQEARSLLKTGHALRLIVGRGGNGQSEGAADDPPPGGNGAASRGDGWKR